MTVLDDVTTIAGVEHYPNFRRSRSGMSIPFNRPLYKTRVECRCGWATRSNEDKKRAESDYRAHIRERRAAAGHPEKVKVGDRVYVQAIPHGGFGEVVEVLRADAWSYRRVRIRFDNGSERVSGLAYIEVKHGDS